MYFSGGLHSDAIAATLVIHSRSGESFNVAANATSASQ
jgi:hypothetical protein